MGSLKIVDAHICLQGEGKYVGVPHILIRMSGCPMRCSFGGSLCDSPFTSWKPEKGSFTEDQIYDLYASNIQINHTMITGGEPFFNETLLNLLISIAKKFNHFITVETAGILFLKTKADFISISPKLRSSIPSEGEYLINNEKVHITSSSVFRHTRLLSDLNPIKKFIKYSKDYQIKPVISNINTDIPEVIKLLRIVGAEKNKVYLMPAGSTNEGLNKIRIPLIEYCQNEGWNYTDRLHIVAYDNKRGV